MLETSPKQKERNQINNKEGVTWSMNEIKGPFLSELEGGRL